MCRNIRTLCNFDPPATDEEIRDASLQFVRKLSGFTKPSRANEAAFDRAVREMTAAARALLDSLVTEAGPRNCEIEDARARARAVERFRRLWTGCGFRGGRTRVVCCDREIWTP